MPAEEVRNLLRLGASKKDLEAIEDAGQVITFPGPPPRETFQATVEQIDFVRG